MKNAKYFGRSNFYNKVSNSCSADADSGNPNTSNQTPLLFLKFIIIIIIINKEITVTEQRK